MVSGNKRWLKATFALVVINTLGMSHSFLLIIIPHDSIFHHMSKFGHPGESYSAYSDPPLLPPPQPGYLLGLYKPLCESTIKRRRLFSFKVGGWGGEGGHGSLDDGCHGFLSKAFGIMAHPLLMSVLEEEGGGGRSWERRRERRGQGEGRGGSLLLMIIE